METIRISNPNEFIDYSLMLLNGFDEVKKIELTENFNFKIVLRGEDWDGRFDQRVAEIVTSMYKLVVRVYAESAGISLKAAKVQLSATRVVAVVDKGSLNLFLEILNTLKESVGKAIEKMEAKHAILAIAIVCSTVLGNKGIDAITQRNTEILRNNLAETESEERIKIITEQSNAIINALSVQYKMIKESRNPAETINNQMSENDEIYFPGTNERYSKEEYKNIIPEVPTIEPAAVERYYADGEYKVLQWSNFGEQKLILEQNGKRLNDVSLLLDSNEQKLLVGAHIDSQAPLHLQVTVTVQEGKAKSAMVIGLDQARPNSRSLSEILY